MSVKGGRIASKSPLHNSAAPGIRGASLDTYQFCSHCNNTVEDEVLQVIRRSRDHKSRTIFFCESCWELIAGSEFSPTHNPASGDMYCCGICEDGCEAGGDLVFLSRISLKRNQHIAGTMVFHDQCFLNETSENFWH